MESQLVQNGLIYLTRSNNSYPRVKAVIYSDRLMVQYMVKNKKKMFYRSTGKNSNLPGTWFPCNGVQRKKYKSKYGVVDRGWIKKPRGSIIWYYFYKKKLLHDEISRFGTLDDMNVSSSIGGGFWDTDVAKPFKEYLKTVIYDDIKQDIDAIKYAIQSEKHLKSLDVSSVLEIF
jgi:hypothetical protein